MKNEYLEKIRELTKEVRLPGVRKYLTQGLVCDRIVTNQPIKRIPFPAYLE